MERKSQQLHFAEIDNANESERAEEMEALKATPQIPVAAAPEKEDHNSDSEEVKCEEDEEEKEEKKEHIMSFIDMAADDVIDQA